MQRANSGIGRQCEAVGDMVFVPCRPAQVVSTGGAIPDGGLGLWQAPTNRTLGGLDSVEGVPAAQDKPKGCLKGKMAASS